MPAKDFAQEFEIYVLTLGKVPGADAIAQPFAQLLGILRAAKTERDRLERDDGLAPKGRSREYTKAVVRAGRQLVAFESSGPLKSLRDNLASTRQSLQPLATGASDDGGWVTGARMRALLQETERARVVREAFARLDGPERDRVFGAMLDADDATVDAILSAPPVLEAPRPGAVPRFTPLVSDRVRDLVLTERARRSRPELAAKVDRLVALEQTLSTAVSTACELLGSSLPGVTESGKTALGELLRQPE